MTEIRECPFCGGHASLHKPSWSIQPHVVCQLCETCGPVASEVSEAVAAWNRRVDDRYTATPTGRAMLKDGE